MAFMALQSAATGLGALSTQLDVISNNLANANNNGFKSSRANFEDLHVSTAAAPGVQDNQADIRPTGIEVGLGTRINGTELDFTQGSPVQTGGQFDVMINGNGFFRVKTLPNQGDGMAYTRTGRFFTNTNGNLVLNSNNGYLLDPPIVIPATASAVDIGNDGRVYVTLPGSTTPSQVGQIQIATFINPQGLTQIGGNLYQDTAASGQAVLDNPGQSKPGHAAKRRPGGQQRRSGQRTGEPDPDATHFEMNSQSIQAADQMLQVVSNLRH